MSVDRAKSDLAALEAKITEAEAHLQEWRASAQKLRAYIEIAPTYENLGSLVPAKMADEPVTATASPRGLQKDSPFYGKSLGAAAVIALEKAGKPLTAAEIVKILKADGWEYVSSNPQLATYWGLRQHVNQTGEAVVLPGVKWALTSWRPSHVAKSVQGLKAARERGVKLGQPRKMTDEKIEQLRELAATGKTTKEIAAIMKMSSVTVGRYKRALKRIDDGTIDPADFIESSGDPDLGPNLGPNVALFARRPY